jgi:hypothetical protein
VVESLQPLLLNTWPVHLRSSEQGLLYAGNRGRDAGGASMSSFMVLIRGYGQSLVYSLEPSVRQQSSPRHYCFRI